MVCKETEKKHWLKIAELQERCKKAISIFQELDGHLDGVATKVVYLGDQLEGVNTPRARAEEAQRLMKQFSEFLKNPFVKSTQLPIDPSKLSEEADVILKLYLISQELPSGGKFDAAKQRIFVKYDQIEKELIEEFVNAQRNDDKLRMKELAKILSHFKGYSQCIDAFIENAQSCYFGTRSIFIEIVPLCQKSQAVVNEVFTTPEQVMSKFVLNIYYGKLQEHIQHQLEAEFKDSELYLKQLYELYSNTNKLSEQLANCKIMGSDYAFLSKLTKSIFAKYLQNYIEVETKNLKEKYNAILDRFYESKNHQKKPIPTGSIQELKRDLQVKIGRANINIGNLANLNINTTTDTNLLKETFLSEEIAISIIQETKDALQRCELLSKMSSNLPNHVIDILDLLLHYLFQEHLDYSIELGLIGLSNFETKPEVKFFEIVGQCNGICHLFEKQFYSSFLPLVASTPKYGECLRRKRETMEQLETKLNNGIEKCISGIIGWIKNVLQNEQKKTDFKPESEDMVDMVNTSACTKVVRFLSGYVQQIVPYLDGKNKESVLMELGVRFHKVVYEHLLQFQYSSIGKRAQWVFKFDCFEFISINLNFRCNVGHSGRQFVSSLCRRI